MHPWVGAGPKDRRRLLEELGRGEISDLFATLPEEIRIDGLDLQPAEDEESLRRSFSGLAGENTTLVEGPSFLGAGVYDHIRPALVDSVLSRAEFFTSYTPYQPEISQGTLQALFEYQTMMCRLTGMEVSNASLYDGATALVEAALFAHRVKRGKKGRFVVAETVHPVYRKVLETYAEAVGIEIVTVAAGDDGRVGLEALREAAGAETCGIALQSPNFLGIVEDLEGVASLCAEVGALSIHVVTEALSMAIFKAGGFCGFDVVCGEAQSFGIAPGFGGPHLGFFCCSEKNVRQMPGRLCGQTLDSEGNRAFCLTLSTREQHIRRAKATSNICSNQGLMVLAATAWLEAVGGEGLRLLARRNYQAAHELARRLEAECPSWTLIFPKAPFFNEFLIHGPIPGTEAVDLLAAQGVLGGVSASRWGGSWKDDLLVAVTEKNTESDLDALLGALGRLG